MSLLRTFSSRKTISCMILLDKRGPLKVTSFNSFFRPCFFQAVECHHQSPTHCSLFSNQVRSEKSWKQMWTKELIVGATVTVLALKSSIPVVNLWIFLHIVHGWQGLPLRAEHWQINWGKRRKHKTEKIISHWARIALFLVSRSPK